MIVDRFVRSFDRQAAALHGHHDSALLQCCHESFPVGIDFDEDAIRSAEENLQLNAQLGPVSLETADLRTWLEAPNRGLADVVTANLTGALLAEWLSTGTGIGGMIQKFSASARFDELWASVALITFVTLLLYNAVQLIENIVLERMGMAATLR